MKITREQAISIIMDGSVLEYEIKITTYDDVVITAGYSDATGLYAESGSYKDQTLKEYEYETVEDLVRDGAEFELKKYYKR